MIEFKETTFMIKSVSPANAEVSSIKPWGAPITSDGALSQYKSTDWGRWQIPQELFSCYKIGLLAQLLDNDWNINLKTDKSFMLTL